MSIQLPVISLRANDSRLMAGLILRSDLSRMPAGTAMVHGMDTGNDEYNVMEPLLTTFENYEIEFTATRSEDQRLSSLMIIVKNFPDAGCWWIAGLIVDPEERRHGHASSLVAALKVRAVGLGALRSEAAAWASDHEAVSFWESQGFTFSRQLSDWRSGVNTPRARIIVSYNF